MCAGCPGGLLCVQGRGCGCVGGAGMMMLLGGRLTRGECEGLGEVIILTPRGQIV